MGTRILRQLEARRHGRRPAAGDTARQATWTLLMRPVWPRRRAHRPRCWDRCPAGAADLNGRDPPAQVFRTSVPFTLYAWQKADAAAVT